MGFPNYGVGGYGSTSGSVPQTMPSLGYYMRLFTSQYQDKSPKLLAFGTFLLRPFIDTGTILDLMIERFFIDEAVGAQLDVLGQILGASRTVGFQPSNNVSPILDDATYRILLKAKIAQNQWDGKVRSLWAIWQSLFPGGVIYFTDNQNMTATIILAGGFTSIAQDLIVNGYIIPRPEAVQYNYTFATLPIFGFDGINAPYIGGFDIGHWA